MRKILVVAVLALVLAGCGDSGKKTPEKVGDAIDATPSTGGIRGVVVDQAIAPVIGAHVLIGDDKQVDTDEHGYFQVSGLAPGDYLVRVSKGGFTDAQTNAHVEANVAEPELVRVLLTRLIGKDPYFETYRLDGFYECGFSAQIPVFFIADTCDFVVRTAYDELNGTIAPPFPRQLQKNVNNQFVDVGPDARTIIQEGFWENSQQPDMYLEIGSTPISNDCDCSETDYLETVMASPSYGRLDRAADVEGNETEFPAGQTVAARGFLNFEASEPRTAQNFKFTILTTVFYNYKAPEGWTFETQAGYPVG